MDSDSDRIEQEIDGGSPSVQPRSEQPGLSRMEIMRGLRIWICEGCLSSANSSLVNGPYPTGFVLYLGASPFVLGLVGAIGPFVNILQLASSYLRHYLGSRRHLVAIPSMISRVLWLPMALVPFVLPHSMWLVSYCTLLFISAALMAISGPFWPDLMSDIVPVDKRGRYFGIRNVYGGVTGMIASVGSGLFFDYVVHQEHWAHKSGYLALFGTAALFGLIGFFFAMASPDPQDKVPRRKPEQGMSVKDAWKTYSVPLRDASFKRIVMLILAITFAQSYGGNFFNAYQLQYLHYSYATIQELSIAVSIPSLLAMPMWGYIVDKYGNKPVMILSSLIVLPIPVIWCTTWPDTIHGIGMIEQGRIVLSASKMTVLFINVLSAFGWSGVGMAQFNLMIGSAPRESRAVYLSVMTALGGLVGAISPILAGSVMQSLTHTVFPATGLLRSNYHALFLSAAVLRLLILYAAVKVTEYQSRSARYVLGQLTSSNPVGTVAAIQRLSRSPASGVRVQAAATLGNMKASLAVEELVHALDDAALPVREQAAESLGKIGDDRAVEPLLAKLSDPASGIATEAAQALGQIGHGAAVPDLVSLALSESSTTIQRVAAAEALGNIYHPQVLPAFTQLLASQMSSIRITVLKSVGQRPDLASNAEMKDALLQLWDSDSDQSDLPLVSEALSQIDEPGIAVRLACGLGRVDSDLSRRAILNSVGSLLGGRDSFYAYLALDRFAADETVTKILTSVQRLVRSNRKEPVQSQGRLIVRVRQALDCYMNGQTQRFTERIGEAIQMAVPLASGKLSGETVDAACAVATCLGERSRLGEISHEELLLLVFILRLIACS